MIPRRPVDLKYPYMEPPVITESYYRRPTLIEIVFLVLGAIAGVIADRTYDVVKHKFSARREEMARSRYQRDNDPITHAHNIVAIFEAYSLADRLYTSKSTDEHFVIPVLPGTPGAYVGVIDQRKDRFVTLSHNRQAIFPVDETIIRRKKHYGTRLWDGAVLYATTVRRVEETEEIIEAGICNYYAYVTLGQRISDESRTVAGAKPLIIGNLSKFACALHGNIRPVTLAASTSCVFEGPAGLEVAIQRRSASVVNATGLAGVMPLFGLEANSSGANKSHYSLLYYNFLKEFVEEFFGLEFENDEFMHAADRPRADVDWIFRESRARALIAEVDAGRVELRSLGACVDLSDGSLTFALAAYFDSPDYLRQLKMDAPGCWESAAPKVGEPTIEFLPLHGRELTQRMVLDQMDATSIFSLDLARGAFG